MKNELDLFSNGKTIFATLKIRPNRTVLTCLWSLVIIGVVVLVFSVVSQSESMTESSVVGLFLLFFLLVIVFVYATWFTRGKEYLVINTKSILYQRDYGLHISNIIEKNFSRLGSSIEVVKEQNHQALGKLRLFTFEQEKPLDLYSSKIVLEIDKLEALRDLIDEIYFNEFNTNNHYIEVSMN